MRIYRHERKILDKAVPCRTSGLDCRYPASPARGYLHQRSVRVISLDRDRDPEVLLDPFTNGAHCCFVSVLYDYRHATGHFVRFVHSWGYTGYRLRNLDRDGVPDFLTAADDRFAYAFTSFGYSGFPAQVLDYRHGRFPDVTRRHRHVVVQDARRQWRYYRRMLGSSLPDVRGVLAAYVADDYLLGRRADASRKVRRALNSGVLSSRFGPPSGRRYVTALHRVLRRTGYAR